MSTVFLIGNGFDLSCGMKTRYIDVYNSYCKPLESDTEIIRKFKKDISSDYKNWSDFEEGMAEYAKTLNSEDEFVECIKNFRNYLQTYLKQEENRFNESIANNEELKTALIDETRKSILEFYSGMTPRITNIVKDINHNYGSKTSFISFNYTNTFDNLIKLVFNTDVDIFHIHGQLDNYLIMGMDNDEQISTKYALTQRGMLAFVKPYFNDEIDPNKMRFAKEKIENANIICAFGLSLGNSDLTWRNTILNSLSHIQNRHLFLFDYQLACEQPSVGNDRLDLELQKRNSILKSWGIQNPEYYANKIHIPCGYKIYNIKEILKGNPQSKVN